MIAVVNHAPVLMRVPRLSDSKENVYEDIGDYPGLGGPTEKYQCGESSEIQQIQMRVLKLACRRVHQRLTFGSCVWVLSMLSR